MVEILQDRSLSDAGPSCPATSRRFHVETFGCQMNVHDSEKMSGILLREGHTRADSDSDANLFLINTCSVREKAESKLYSYLGRLGKRKRAGHDIIIGVTGCVAQQEGRTLFESAPCVDFLIGTHQVAAIADVVRQVDEVRGRAVRTAMRSEIAEIDPDVADRSQPGRAFVTIMEGCDKFCTFCVIPYTRGRERYRSMEAILGEVRYLEGQGFAEIQLLGQNVDCWKEGSRTFVELLKAIENTSVRWLRFITSHPAHLTREAAEWMGRSRKLCPQIHLPLQAGSNRVLERMRREYTREQFLERVAWLRAARPGISISTDIIAGFPGETEDDFRQTLETCRDTGFDSMFSFIYSVRKYSAACNWPDDIPAAVKTDRLIRLQSEQRQIQVEKNSRLVGQELDVLVDGSSRKDAQVWSGHSSCNRVVNFVDVDAPRVGEIVKVRITNSGPNSLFGERLNS